MAIALSEPFKNDTLEGLISISTCDFEASDLATKTADPNAAESEGF